MRLSALADNRRRADTGDAMDARTPSPGRRGTSPIPRTRYGISEALADIKRLHEEMQSDGVPKQETRPSWQSFAWGFAIGAACFAAVIVAVTFLG
jgi:hypothetical protein